MSGSGEGEVLLRVEGLEAGYAEIRALLGIGLELRRGQVVTLLGANGAGKTTTLKTISGLVRARAGTITLGGQNITNRPAYEIARMGLVHVPGGAAHPARPFGAGEPRARRLRRPLGREAPAQDG